MIAGREICCWAYPPSVLDSRQVRLSGYPGRDSCFDGPQPFLAGHIKTPSLICRKHKGDPFLGCVAVMMRRLHLIPGSFDLGFYAKRMPVMLQLSLFHFLISFSLGHGVSSLPGHETHVLSPGAPLFTSEMSISINALHGNPVSS